MLYNLGQIRQQVAQLAGTQNTLGVYDFDDTTYPTSGLANNFINDSIREICGSWDFTFLETSKSYPFYHNISGVQSLYLSGTTSGGTPITGIVTPYPGDVLSYAWSAANNPAQIANNFSGIAFSGRAASGTTYQGTSVSGVQTTAIWSGVGYVYQLDADIDKFLAPGIVIAHSTGNNTAAGVICQNTPMEDITRLIPIGIINASGTPSFFTEFPGMSTDNNKAIQFFPFPTPSYSGQTFIVPYKKRHIDMVDDNEKQNMIPESWQRIIVNATLEKVFDLSAPDKVSLVTARKEGLIAQMKVWDAMQPSKIYHWRDFNFNSSTNSAYDSSVWFHLSDSPGR